MTLNDLAKAIGAQVVASNGSGAPEIDHVFAGDRMSDLLNEVTDTALLVTNLAHVALMRPIELMDVPGICLVNGVEPEVALVEAARRHGTALMISPFGMFETCGRLYVAMTAERGGDLGT